MTLRASLALVLPFLVPGCAGSGDFSGEGPEVKRILGDSRYEWVTLETEHTRIHFPAGSYAETVADNLPGRAEGARTEVLQRLSVSGDPHLLHLFYVDSREDMANLTGSLVTGYTYSSDRAVVVVFNEDWRAFERHEFTHAITLGTWSAPAGPAVVEGLATYIDGTCGGYENGRITRSFLDRGWLIPLTTLMGDFRGQDDLIAYLQAGTLFEFVLGSEGSEVMSLLWTQGLLAAPMVLGMSQAEFEEAFEGWVRAKYFPITDIAMDAIRTGGCGITAPGAGQE